MEVMSDQLQRTAETASYHLDEIKSLFKPGVKLTLLVRTPEHPDRDFLLSDDDLSEVSAAVDAVIAGAPGALDTLNELAAALGNDADFAATVTALINEKYTKPGTGIPKADLEAVVQTSLGLADTALQNIPDNSVTNTKIADSAVGISELSAAGTPNATTFLRGDNTWSAPPGGVPSVIDGGTPTSSGDPGMIDGGIP